MIGPEGALPSGAAPLVTADVRMLGASGIGEYLAHLLPRLLQAGRPRFHLIGDAARVNAAAGGCSAPVSACDAPIYSLAEQLCLPRRIPRESSLFWAPHYNVPLLHAGRLVVTVHDVLHLARPDLFPGAHRRLYARLLFARVRARAARILCVSRFTADELVRLVGVRRSALRVVYNAADDWFDLAPRMRPISEPYLLYVGNVKPHKNLAGLLDAFAAIADRVPHSVVIVGRKEGFITGDAAVVRRADGFGGRVHFTGWVDDDVLRQYFLHAEALVLPSFYEGFGLPPLQAMACGCPVVVARAGALPEVCADAALYCDPARSADLAAVLLRLLQNPALRQEMRERGVERARAFSWDRCAAETREVFEEVLASG